MPATKRKIRNSFQIFRKILAARASDVFRLFLNFCTKKNQRPKFELKPEMPSARKIISLIFLKFIFMKSFVSLLPVLLSLILTANVFAQSRDLTIILLRHAEKAAPTASMEKNNPELSAAGKERAEKLIETLRKYQPNQIYSSAYQRTRATVLPLAENLDPRYRIQIQLYDHGELEELAARLLKNQSGTLVVVGHNTTTPTLANLLIKQEKYKYLDESEYDKIFIIKIKGNKITDEVIKY